jgi:hypothetical protein
LILTNGMRAFLADIIPKIQKYTRKLDELTLLLDHHWVLIDQSSTIKNIYIFRSNNELLISANGKVEKSRWDYLGNKSLLIENTEGSFLFKIGFFDENVLALKLDNTDGYIFLVNETRASKNLNSIESIIDFLSSKYLAESDEKNDIVGNSSENNLLPSAKAEPERFPLVLGIVLILITIVSIVVFSNISTIKKGQPLSPKLNENTSAATIKLGKDTIYFNQPWEIVILVRNGTLRNFDRFPEIEGLRKKGTSTKSNTDIIKGQIISWQSIAMVYTPIKTGSLIIPPFQIKINDEFVSSPGKSVTVLSTIVK